MISAERSFYTIIQFSRALPVLPVRTHRLRRPGERVATVTPFRLADVREVNVVEGKDSDGDLVYAQAGERARVIRRFLGL